MAHELLWKVLTAQRMNATLSGAELRSAAEDLIQVRISGRAVLKAFDAAGERIVGAAMTLSDDPLEMFDYTRPFPDGATCLLVGGVIAGPVGVADMAAAVMAAGARRVEVAMLCDWSAPIQHVACIRRIGGGARARVA